MSVKVHIYGQMGTGKTALCRRFGENIEAQAKALKKNLKYVYINLAYTSRPYQVMTQLLDEVSFVESPRSGLSPASYDDTFLEGEMLKRKQVEKTILEMSKRNIIVLTLKGNEKYYEFTPEFKAVIKQTEKEYERHEEQTKKESTKFTILCLVEHCGRLTEDEMIPMTTVLSAMFHQKASQLRGNLEMTKE